MKLKPRLIVFPLVVIALLFSGCLPSYYPLFTPEQRIIKDELLGAWENKEGTFIFERDTLRNSNRYLMTQISSSGDTARFYADLGQLDSYYFLDLSLREPPKNDTWSALHLVPVHTFSKISFDGDQLKIAMYNEAWLKKRIRQRQIRIKHEEKSDGSILLTAPTEELQKFMVKYAEEYKAFVNLETLTRISDS
ncbi:MAG: hypothetical protein ACQETE_16245 [Bacteroidota bacterium]